MPPLNAQPSNPLIDFFRSYGPSSTSDSLCDENVGNALHSYGVAPIDTPAQRLTDVAAALFGGEGENVVLTGTAGDGKTYHIRKFFLEHFPDRHAEWPGEAGILTIPIDGDKELRIIRDLSEISASEKQKELTTFTSSLIGENKNTLYLVAANDGQLLKYFRDAAAEGGPLAERCKSLHLQLTNMMRSDRESVSGLNLKLFNLSRLDVKAADEIFDAVLSHPSWSNCEGCLCHETCPIRINRSLLLDSVQNRSPFRHRIRQSLRLSAANDQHVPIRQLLTLIVNTLLGDSKNSDIPLLTCDVARERAHNNQYQFTNPYNNIIGQNLRMDRRRANRVFNVLEVFGIGLETNNLIDTILVQGQPAEIWDGLFNDDHIYGARLFEPCRKAYFSSNGRDERAVQAFRRALESQRRRAFFRLASDVDRQMASPWRLTIFHHGDEYLRLLHALEESKGRDVLDPFVRQLVRGLNRAFTGMMTNDENKLWLAGTIGKTDDLAGRVSTIDAIDRTNTAAFNVRIYLDEVKKRPALRIDKPRYAHVVARMPALDIRPLLFEYLMRVANGSLPASFSRQCHQEIRHFALNSVSAIRSATERGDESDLEQVHILSLGGHGEIQANLIEI